MFRLIYLMIFGHVDIIEIDEMWRFSKKKNGNYGYVIRDRYIFPWQFYEEKRGACSAYSVFADFPLKLAGYSPRFFLVGWPQKSVSRKLTNTHDITVYRDKKTGRYNYFDQHGLNDVQAKTLQDLFTSAIPQWNSAEELKVVNGVVQVVDDANSFFIYRK